MLTREEIEQRRDVTFRRTPQLQVRTIAQAEAFINAVGFCFAFKANRSELPCLWHAAAGERHPIYPLHVQHDPYIGLVWDVKDQLATEKRVYYGKAIKRRPSFISLEFFPLFYRLELERRRGSYADEYAAGRLSREAKRILDSLYERSPQVTAELKTNAGLSAPAKRRLFDEAMAELQSRFLIVKIAEFYEPFTFLWELVERRFTEEIVGAADIDPQEARIKILRRYFEVMIISSPQAVERLFGWSSREIDEALHRLVEENVLTDAVRITGEKKPLFGLGELV